MVPLKLLKMPVPDDFFNLPPLAPDKIQELRAVGYRAQRDLLEYTKLTGGPVEWTLHTNESKVQVYTAREGNLPLFLGTTEVESTLDEVRAILTAPTTSDVRRVNAAYFPDVLDEVRLYTLSTPTEDRPHHLSSVSWTVLGSPLQGRIVRYRDFCNIEHLEDVEMRRVPQEVWLIHEENKLPTLRRGRLQQSLQYKMEIDHGESPSPAPRVHPLYPRAKRSRAGDDALVDADDENGAARRPVRRLRVVQLALHKSFQATAELFVRMDAWIAARSLSISRNAMALSSVTTTQSEASVIYEEGGVFDICDPRVQRSVHYFGSPKGATQRRRGDMLLLY
ncbi:hypothetical protein Ae201684P_003957 [Aphanomyces euteiches]|uniref:START domain-containing protein n=1 Tax=Aphanomyces euteiches TaxID=100861 RepID=A0A6G0XTK7_9STRA|nr:hypothetical protein Ae201684_001521 [Aphanomyces euteiches]KAH9075275.1 hypothetical protein Ae201684P_003957 [Aphanomyces euteiches]KAH9153958.1 hypothetical protein AeRB84_003877 [Aphanomyces euteiches]